MKKLIVALATLALLPAGYVGSYFALRTRALVGLCDGGVCHFQRHPSYRIDNIFTRATYAPALWLDQRIRPQYWAWSEEFDMQPDVQPPPDP